jgi:hypothetical protein
VLTGWEVSCTLTDAGNKDFLECVCKSSLIVEVISRLRQFEYDLLSKTDDRSRILGMQYSVCINTFVQLPMSTRVAKSLHITFCYLDTPHEEQASTTYPNMPASTHCRRTYPGRLSFALVVHQSDSDVESRCSKQKQDIE